MQCPESIKCDQDENPRISDAIHPDDKTLDLSRDADTVVLLRAAQHYLTKPDRPIEDFSVFAFNKAGAQHAAALPALLSNVRSHTWSLCASYAFDGFLRYEITLSKSSKRKFKTFDVIANGMVFF